MHKNKQEYKHQAGIRKPDNCDCEPFRLATE